MIRKVLLGVSFAAVSACSMAPKYVQPELPVPTGWPTGDAYLRQSEATLPSVTYRDIFRDPRLQAIIAQALVNNRDLRVAAANIEVARAQYRIQRAELFPEIGTTANYQRRDNGTGGVINNTGTGTGTGNGGGVGTIDPTTGTGTGTGTGVGTGNTGTNITTGNGARSSFSVNVGITAFEVDLFGRIRSLTTAAQNRYFATEATARATRLTLVGDIATAWLTYASDQSLLRIAQETATSAQRSVSLTKMRLDGGIAPRTDLAQALIVLQTAQSDLATQTTLVAQDANALQLLVGAPVDPALLPKSIEEVAPTIAELPAGLNSTILLRRPDVLQAEYELRATNAEIGAARAALFPRISLTALAGLASTSLSNLFTGGAFNYSVSPSANYSIFQAGAARAGVAQTRAQRDAALATYELAIQTAFSEVADGLARRGTIDRQLAAQVALSAAATDNYRLSDARYRGGIDTFLQSLDAQRSLYSAQRTLVTTRLTGATNLVTLYRVLGGDSLLDAAANGPRPVAAQPTNGPAATIR
jgi:multidrug efflux system outer membrane protein